MKITLSTLIFILTSINSFADCNYRPNRTSFCYDSHTCTDLDTVEAALNAKNYHLDQTSTNILKFETTGQSQSIPTLFLLGYQMRTYRFEINLTTADHQVTASTRGKYKELSDFNINQYDHKVYGSILPFATPPNFEKINAMKKLALEKAINAIEPCVQ
jgi:hypothetical protein